MKTAIIYYSRHHENTLKLLRAIVQEHSGVTLIDACEAGDLSDYDLIGFASGIYYGQFHKSVIRAAQEKLPRGKKTFLICTYAMRREGYTQRVRTAIEASGGEVLGEYGCLGFNTFGPFALIGGIAKGRPNAQDTAGAVSFYKKMLEGAH